MQQYLVPRPPNQHALNQEAHVQLQLAVFWHGIFSLDFQIHHTTPHHPASKKDIIRQR